MESAIAITLNLTMIMLYFASMVEPVLVVIIVLVMIAVGFYLLSHIVHSRNRDTIPGCDKRFEVSEPEYYEAHSFVSDDFETVFKKHDSSFKQDNIFQGNMPKVLRFSSPKQSSSNDEDDRVRMSLFRDNTPTDKTSRNIFLRPLVHLLSSF